VDQDDFEQFYTASYQRLLWELFAVTGGDLHEAEDALQEPMSARRCTGSGSAATRHRRHGSAEWR
jgi:hypothetical protein